jgi:hypothetical protein
LANVRAKMLLFFQFVWLTNYNDIKVDSEKTKSGSNSEPGSPTTSLRKRCYLCVSDGTKIYQFMFKMRTNCMQSAFGKAMHWMHLKKIHIQ